MRHYQVSFVHLPMPATTTEIAKVVGCSIATVSRVLNNSGPVSSEVRSAVLDAVRESGSMPRLLGRRPPKVETRVAGRSPQRDRSGFVQVVLVRRDAAELLKGRDETEHSAPAQSAADLSRRAPQHVGSFHQHLINGVVSELEQFGDRPVMRLTADLQSPLLLEEVADPSNRGLILIGDYIPDETEKFIARAHCPVTTLCGWLGSSMPDYVGIDNALGTRQAMQHLLSLGHTKIAYLSGDLSRLAFAERHDAYRLELAAAGIAYRPEYTVTGATPDGAHHLLSLSDRPTAILTQYDASAAAVVRAARDLGLSVPNDLSVVGFDDDDIAAVVTPSLTTVRVPLDDMGRIAVQMLMMRRNLRQSSPVSSSVSALAYSVRVRPKLVIRESTAAPPQ